MILPIVAGLLLQTGPAFRVLPDNKPRIIFGPSSSIPTLDGQTFTFPAKEYDITISTDGDTIKIKFTKKKGIK